jgi:chromate transporter
LPSLVIILIIAAVLSNFAEIPAVQMAFAGIRVCVCVLIANTVIKLWKSAVVDKPSIIIFAAVFLISVFTSLSTAILVIAAGVVGVAISMLRKGTQK